MPPFVVCVLVCLLLGSHEPQREQKSGSYPRAELLIEAGDLARPEVAERSRVLDVRARKDYQAGHVPGAVWVDAAVWAKAFAFTPDEKAWAKRIGALAVKADTPLVVYGDGVTPDAARIWWILRYWGMKDVRLLNGGWRTWQANGGKVSTDEPKLTAQPIELTPGTARLATKAQVLEGLQGKQVQIIDTRSRDEYCGETNTAKRNGAIPGAVHLEWVDVIDKKSQRIKGPGELSKLFRERGIDLDRPAVTHCQSGGRASVMAFALELMGAKDVRNYYKSWAEWGNADETPVVKPEK